VGNSKENSSKKPGKEEDDEPETYDNLEQELIKMSSAQDLLPIPKKES